jgi:hypothetical protein
MIPNRLIEAARNRRLVPFVGAGMSKQADPQHFPNWTELLERLIEASQRASYLSTDDATLLQSMLVSHRHLMVAESLKSRLPIDFYASFLESQFSPPNIGPARVHKLLFDLSPALIVTTNYDRLIEDAYATTAHKAMTVIDYSDPGAMQRRLQDHNRVHRPFLFKMHGDIDDTRGLVLSESDYRRLLYDEQGYKMVLSSIFIHYVVLMLGFSFADEELNLTLGQLRHFLKSSSSPDYILLPHTAVNLLEAERFRKDFGLEVITYPATPDHRGLEDFLSNLILEANVRNA